MHFNYTGPVNLVFEHIKHIPRNCILLLQLMETKDANHLHKIRQGQVWKVLQALSSCKGHWIVPENKNAWHARICISPPHPTPTSPSQKTKHCYFYTYYKCTLFIYSPGLWFIKGGGIIQLIRPPSTPPPKKIGKIHCGTHFPIVLLRGGINITN